VKAVIIAGGLGTRLQPYTTFLPKPMLPLDEKPILEHIINWTKKAESNQLFCVSVILEKLLKTILKMVKNLELK